MAAETIVLPSPLLNSLQELAHERGESVESVVVDLVRDYLREQRHAQLAAEMERFREQHAALRVQYEGQYVGLYNGQVLDHDLEGVCFTGACSSALVRKLS